MGLFYTSLKAINYGLWEVPSIILDELLLQSYNVPWKFKKINTNVQTIFDVNYFSEPSNLYKKTYLMMHHCKSWFIYLVLKIYVLFYFKLAKLSKFPQLLIKNLNKKGHNSQWWKDEFFGDCFAIWRK